MNLQSGVNSYVVTAESELDAQYEEDSFEPDEKLDVFVCPECNAELFDNEEDSLKFLTGAKVKKVGKYYKAID